MNNQINYLQLVLTFATVVSTTLLTWFLNSVSKRNEIKLVNYHKDQIDKTKELYSKLSDINILINYFFLDDRNPLSLGEFKGRITQLTKSFQYSYSFFLRNRILFPDELKIKLENYFQEFRKRRKVLFAQKETIEHVEQQYEYDDLGNLYEEEMYVNSIIEAFVKKEEIIELRNSSKQILTDLETYFKKLVN